MVFFIITEFLYLDMTGLGRWRALRKFPKVADKLGFKLKRTAPSQFGIYTGNYNGYGFNIDPDSNATISLKMSNIPGLRLSTHKNNANFSTGNHEFDTLFKERMVPPEIKQKLSEDAKLVDFIGGFGKRWKSRCFFIEIVQDGIWCSLKYGNGGYIPGPVLAQIVPDMVKLADLLQNEMRKE